MLSDFLRVSALFLLYTTYGWNSVGVVSGADNWNKLEETITKHRYVHSKQISENGDSLIIGFKPKETEPDKLPEELFCTRHTSKHFYKDEYNLNVSTRARDYFLIDKDITNVDYSKYFFFIFKEAWSCTKKDETSIGIMMIVNELIGIKEIFEVKYYDGVEVSTEYLPDGTRTARVKETKFIKVDNPFVAIRFEGKLNYVRGHSHYNIPGFARTKFETQVEKFENDMIKEVKFTLSDTNTKSTIISESGQGKTLRIGSPWKKVFGNETFLSACFLQQGLNPFPYEFRTTVYDLLATSDSSQKISALLTEKFFNEYFIPIRQEVWTCTPMEGQIFLRIVNEVVGRKEVKEVQSVDGITAIHSIDIGLSEENGPKTVRFREVKFLNPVTKEVLKYEGALRLVEDKSSTAENNIPFKLHANRLYRVLINAKGYDLRVGSRWEREIGSTNDIAICTEKDGAFYKAYRTKFRIKTEIKIGDIVSYRLEYIRKYRKHEYYEFSDGEFLECEGTTVDKEGNKIKFLRISNEMEVLVPVHEIEFYDGIEVFERISRSKTKSVRIREVKYLSTDGKLDVLKYEGKIQLPNSEAKNMEKGWYAIMVQNNDIFWRIGHLTGRKHELRERTYTLADNEYNTLVIGLVKDEIFLGENLKNPNNDLGGENSIVVCRKTDGRLKDIKGRQFTRVKQKIHGQQNPSIILDSADYLFFSKEEIWECQEQNNDLVFERIMNRFCLIKRNFGKINFKESEKVWVEVTSDEPKNQVEVEEIVYRKNTGFASTSQNTLRKYQGYTVLDEGSDSTGVKMSGTNIFEDDEEKFDRLLDYLVADIKYLTDRESEYHETFLNDEGESLIIGSKWEETFGSAAMTMTCQEVAFQKGLFDTYLRTRVKKLDGEDINNQLLFQTYFEDLKTEMWYCNEKGISNRGGFWRILTQFSIKHHHCNQIAKILHYDGVTVLLGNYIRSHGSAGCMEIAEVKYLKRKTYIPLKFEGKLQLIRGNNPIPKKIKSVRLADVLQIEIHNQPEPHIKNKVFKTVVQDEGSTIEVGSPHEDVIKMRKAECIKMHVGEGDERKKVRIVKSPKPTGPITEMKQGEFKKCFDIIDSEMWICRENRENQFTFKRVVNKFSAKESCKIARVYHHPGVTVDVKPILTITEIKYITDSGQNFKISRFEGFVSIVEEHYSPTDDDTFGVETKEIEYALDIPSLFVTEVEREGIILEVGSHWEKEFGTADDSVLCERKMNHTNKKSYNTKVMMGSSDSSKVEMDHETFSRFFDVLRQEVYICKKNEDEKFLRVVNVNVALNGIARIYHPDGITIEKQVFPDRTESKKIIEIKYLDPVTETVLRYNGEMTLESIISNRQNKLFQMPNEFQTYNTDTRTADEIKFWPVDVLRVHALRVTQSAGAEDHLNEVEPVKYTPKNLNVTRIAEGCDVKMRVGSQWQEEFTTDGNEMKCILDEWNPTNKRQFLTKVQLYYDNDKYELNYDTINDNFIIKKIEVWICVNKDDTMLRVVTTLEGTTGIFVVLHRDGVKVEPLKLEDGGSSARIIETKFMHPKNFKILKYAGILKLFTPTAKQIMKTEIAPPQRSSALTEFKAEWKGKLRDWWLTVKGIPKAVRDYVREVNIF
ncbi:hypothetical protein LSTR_LSTR006059 [Laodelphax striatellus]|uniref:Vitellogenin domain-containing protein n=1 Tax=Laodelphax striatellus TaxID=195883 RepID=A0A482XNQ9_LAOST|nr:hypothetical protein LSTR_LSTR006059 [Laodelphax striatellus]